MGKRDFASGLPDPRRFGDASQLPLNTLISYIIQSHNAARAGKHFDIRLGPDMGHKPTMLSWAARHLPEKPGEKRMVFQQPLHTGAYSNFAGKIERGYGRGDVATHSRGRVTVTKATPNQINFVVDAKGNPKKFTLVRKGGRPAKPQTAREARTQGGNWLFVNTSPVEAIKRKIVREIFPESGKLLEVAPAESASLKDRENAMASGDKHPAELAATHTKVAYSVDPRLAAAYAGLNMPGSISGAAGELGSNVAFLPTLKSVGTIGSHVGQRALGRPAAALGGKLAARWAPKALAKGMGIGAKANPYGLLIAPLLEVGLNNVPEALQDPRYKSGKIGFTRALGGSIGRGAEAMQAKTQEQYEKGLLRGAITSGVGGVFNPVANITGLGQAAWRAIKSPFQWLAGSKKSSYRVLAPIIKQAVEQLGGEGETMVALVKAARRPMLRGYSPVAPRPTPVPAPAPDAPEKVTFGNRLRGLFMGMDPKTIQTLQGGARSLASVIEKLKLAGIMPAA